MSKYLARILFEHIVATYLLLSFCILDFIILFFLFLCTYYKFYLSNLTFNFYRSNSNVKKTIMQVRWYVESCWLSIGEKSIYFKSQKRNRFLWQFFFSYFNIWCEAKAGWSVYMKRRTAVQKISSLSEASSTDLANFDDVCAICYQEMTSAKITRCKHYFHGVCLRKWLYVQDKVRVLEKEQIET